jgi:ABC-type Fe3+/spermidine/putrescine transport system ATPase subunit
MNEGRIEQIGNPREIYLRPATKFVAEFIGTSNMLSAVAGETIDGRLKLETSEGVLWHEGETSVAAGSDILVSIRPERIEISTERVADDRVNTWRGNVVTRAFLGDSAEHVVTVGKHEFRVRSDAARLIPPGTEVFLSVPPQHVTLISLE